MSVSDALNRIEDEGRHTCRRDIFVVVRNGGVVDESVGDHCVLQKRFYSSDFQFDREWCLMGLMRWRFSHDTSITGKQGKKKCRMRFPRSSGSDNKRQAHDAHPPFVPKLRYFCYAIADKNLIPSVLPFHIFFRNPIVILGRRRSHSYYTDYSVRRQLCSLRCC